MIKIALAVGDKKVLTGDDLLLIDFVKKSYPNIKLDVHSLLDKNVDWSNYNVINIKTVYGYYNHITEFNDWLDHISLLKNTRIINPISIIKWNMGKIYLEELRQNQIEIMPTLFYDIIDEINLEQIYQDYNWQKIVIKPTISAGGYNLFFCNPQEKESLNLGYAHIQKLQNNKSKIIIQEYSNAVSENGEFSAIFIGGKYCYLVNKKAKDNLVASYSQGIEIKSSDNKRIINKAEEIYNKMKNIIPDFAKLAYARIDLIEDGNNIYLMEIELIEPRLFFNFASDNDIKNYIELHL